MSGGSPGPEEVLVDVRDDIRRGREPFERIMAAVTTLRPDQVLVLRAPFEPAPLYAVLGRKGFTHRAERRAADDWWIWFHREVAPSPAPDAPPPASPDPRTVVLDVRGLEPPQPMLQVLERLDALRPGWRLEVLHDRRPVFLYPQLEDRGFVHETDEPSAGIVRILIHRPSDTG